MGPHLIPLVFVFGLVLLVQMRIYRAAKESRSSADDPTTLGELIRIFSEDIERRARHGRGPDWLHYLDEGERQFELHIDRLRTFAAAALAVGLGGTILSLVANLLFELSFRSTENLEIEHLVHGTVISLSGSLVGVVFHLLIVLRLMRRSENRFAQDFHAWKLRLRAVSKEHDPREAFSETLLKGLAPIREGLKEEISGVFGVAIPGFPQAVAGLGEHLDRLSRVVEKQGSVIEAAVANLQGTASAMERLAPAAEALAGASAALAALPEKLGSTLAESRERWLADLREEEGIHLGEILSFHREIEGTSAARERQMADLVRNLQSAVAEVRDEIGRAPGLLTETIASLSRQLGIEFGQHARDSTNELAAHLKEQQEMLLLRLERREQELRNNVGLIVKELFDQLSGTIERQIVDRLSVVGEELSRASAALPAAAQRFEDASGEWYRSQEKALQGWHEAADRIQEGARFLGSADGQLQNAVGSIGAAADHLGRVATLTDHFDERLRQALHDAAAKPLEDLVEVRRELQTMVACSRAYQSQLEKTLSRQSVFIRRCLRLVIGRVPGNGRTSRNPTGLTPATEGDVP